MGTSKNDIELFDGRVRVQSRAHKGEYEAKMSLINPQTNRPYTYYEIVKELERLQEKNPQLASLTDPWIKKLGPKAQVSPDKVFSVYSKGKEKAIAKERLLHVRGKELESLAKLLFRPLYESNLKSGNLTVNNYFLYEKEALYIGELPDVRFRLMGCLQNYILPQIGDIKLNELNKESQKKVLEDINRLLRKKKCKASLCGYVRRAYKGLLEAIESSGWKECCVGMRLIDIITQKSERNTAIRGSVRTDHLDNEQRTNLFRLIRDPGLEYECFLVGLIYSGLDLSEIAAARFNDFEVIELQGGEVCHTLTVTKRVRKLNERYSTFNANNEAFPIQKLRRIVLYPWAADLMWIWLDVLRDRGYSDQEIENMRLSDLNTANPIMGPKELSDILVPLMERAGVKETKVTRTNKDGRPYLETLPVDVELLRRDARYMAQYCGADPIMEHAMFGDTWTETDEQAYLDLLGDRYAVARYYHLRRWSPYVSKATPFKSDKAIIGYKNVPGHYILEISNPADHPTTFTLSATFGIHLQWEIKKEVFNHETES